MTQRIFEAILSGCGPITPTVTRSAARFTPVRLHAATGADVIGLCRWLARIAGTREHACLLDQCLKRLDLFRLSRQIVVLENVLRGRMATAT
jgi:hypothetical protein